MRSLALWPVAVALGDRRRARCARLAGGPAGPPPSTTPYVAPPVDPEPQTTQASEDTAVNDAGFAAELARADLPLPATLRPSLNNLIRRRVPRPGGLHRRPGRVRHRICVLGDPEAKRSIALFGDSHAGMWLEPLERLAKSGHWRIFIFLKASCLPVDATGYRVDKHRPYTECDSTAAGRTPREARMKPDRIIISGLLAQYFADPADSTKMLSIDPVGRSSRGVRCTRCRPRTITPRGARDRRHPESRRGSCGLPGLPQGHDGHLRRTARPAYRGTQRGLEGGSGRHGYAFVNPVPWFCATGPARSSSAT